jgi:adenosylhomocysteine nucleosidase
MEIAETVVINGRTYYIGRLGDNDVVMVLSGISMVNAAMTAQTVVDHFDVDAILFSGIAGGVNPGLDIGDVVVPARWGEYQENRFARETGDGWDVDSLSWEFDNYGMMFPRKVRVTRKDAAPDEEERVFWFPSDSTMLDVARRSARGVRLGKCTSAGDCLEEDPEVVVGGNGVSGPTFVDNEDYRSYVWQTFGADALDMESAAVAHVAYTNNVPFIAFRSLSDLAGGGPRQDEVRVFREIVTGNSTSVVMAFLEQWAKR